jgi:hypothetical protein
MSNGIIAREIEIRNLIARLADKDAEIAALKDEIELLQRTEIAALRTALLPFAVAAVRFTRPVAALGEEIVCGVTASAWRKAVELTGGE